MKPITRHGTLLAHGINGSPLSPGHGFPLRINMPGLYGQKMPKWITQLEFTDKPITRHWEGQGWSDTADVQTNSKVLQPHIAGIADDVGDVRELSSGASIESGFHAVS